MKLSDLEMPPERNTRKVVSDDDELRPSTLDQFVGQTDTIAQLRIMTLAAKERGEPIDHILMTGSGGLGKTTIGLMMANEMGAPFLATSASLLNSVTLAKTFAQMKKNTVLHLEEGHAIKRDPMLLLLSAMEDRWLDVSLGTGHFERIDVPPFTLVCATTNPGRLTESFKDRFGYQARLEFYPYRDMLTIIERSASVMKLNITGEAIDEIATRSRGIPRVSNNLLKRIRDYHQMQNCVGPVDKGCAISTFGILDIDSLGLDKLDQKVLAAIQYQFSGGPIGIENLSLFVGDESDTVSKDVEPFLVRLGLIIRTPRGRYISQLGKRHLDDITDK